MLTHGGAAPTLGTRVVVVVTWPLPARTLSASCAHCCCGERQLGLLVTAWMIGVRLRVGSLADDEVAWRYYLSCVWLAVVSQMTVNATP